LRQPIDPHEHGSKDDNNGIRRHHFSFPSPDLEPCPVTRFPINSFPPLAVFSLGRPCSLYLSPLRSLIPLYFVRINSMLFRQCEGVLFILSPYADRSLLSCLGVGPAGNVGRGSDLPDLLANWPVNASHARCYK
jgi:hypothetical protein